MDDKYVKCSRLSKVGRQFWKIFLEISMWNFAYICGHNVIPRNSKKGHLRKIKINYETTIYQ